VTTLLACACLALALAVYGYLGRLAVAKGYRAGESGSILELAWPLFIRLAPSFFGIAVASGLAAAIWALL
jgi:hypothetical protein